ncbi:Bdr family repetitive protein [Borreliella burgdorferi]|uniref:Bdr family repetitive protein n=1 Tax=Borreliella burgdorferi TaxID=139 RepID=UPI00017F3182|nr:Bdr family repetitive protein [Borreliella burgdorferi]ACN55134.1 KID repeat protein [Borreliella burgdorferi WI91-23]
MSNLAYNALKIENIRLEFLNKGFSEEAIDFVLLQNDNYNFEVLKEKMNSLEQQIINVEKNFQKDVDSIYIKIDSVNTKIDNVEKALQKDISSLDTKIDSVKNELNAKIDSVNTKIDSVEKNLQKDISSLDNKIDILKNELNASNRTIQVILIMGITLAPIIYSIFNKYFFN